MFFESCQSRFSLHKRVVFVNWLAAPAARPVIYLVRNWCTFFRPCKLYLVLCPSIERVLVWYAEWLTSFNKRRRKWKAVCWRHKTSRISLRSWSKSTMSAVYSSRSSSMRLPLPSSSRSRQKGPSFFISLKSKCKSSKDVCFSQLEWSATVSCARAIISVSVFPIYRCESSPLPKFRQGVGCVGSCWAGTLNRENCGHGLPSYKLVFALVID